MYRAEEIGDFVRSELIDMLYFSQRTDEDMTGKKWFDVHEAERQAGSVEDLAGLSVLFNCGRKRSETDL